MGSFLLRSKPKKAATTTTELRRLVERSGRPRGHSLLLYCTIFHENSSTHELLVWKGKAARPLRELYMRASSTVLDLTSLWYISKCN